MQPSQKQPEVIQAKSDDQEAKTAEVSAPSELPQPVADEPMQKQDKVQQHKEERSDQAEEKTEAAETSEAPVAEQKIQAPKPVVTAFAQLPTAESIGSETMTYEGEHQVTDKISIYISGSVQKGSTISKYTAYVIVGEDDKGKIEMLRRYSEFDALRNLMKDRWPGCFIPAVPDKTMMSKNSAQVVHERQRMLSNFLKAVALSPHLYYSEQFQLFIRSPETDISATFDRMHKSIQLDEVLNRYKEVFTILGGKEVDSAASLKISTFKSSLRKVSQQLAQLLDAAISMAQSKDIVNDRLPQLYAILTRYERNTVQEFAEGRQDRLVYLRQSNEVVKNHGEMIKKAATNNPYWLLSDLIKLQMKDCQSFLEMIDKIDQLSQKRMDCETLIRDYEVEIDELAMGKSTVSSMTTRKSKEEVKRIIEDKKSKCIVEKHNYMMLTDMVTILIAYLEVDTYRKLKKIYYTGMVKKIAAAEAYVSSTLQRMMADIGNSIQQMGIPTS